MALPRLLDRSPIAARLRLVLGLVLGIAVAPPAAAQPYGLGPPGAVGPFLNGILPSETPNDYTQLGWAVVPAFPGVTFDDTTVIASNPANGRLYVASRSGVIYSIDGTDPATTVKTPFLDLSDRVAVVWDGGFLGLAFHPSFGDPGSPYRNDVFVYYSSHCPLNATRDAIEPSACDQNYPGSSTGGFFGTYLRLSRYTVPDGSLAADPASEQILINIRLYNASHRGGGITFGDDGYLWLTIGDQFRYTTAQDITNTLEGGVMRLDVDVTDQGGGAFACDAPGSHLPIRTFDGGVTVGETDETSGRYYCIPDSNPWQSPFGGAFEEYATIGNRAPHRLTGDMATGRLWSGEVGGSVREEINIIEMGNNYGWPFREGLTTGPYAPPPSYIGTLTDPIVDFDRSEAIAIIGGYVYRGSLFPELYGVYLAGDYGTNAIFAITWDEQTGNATKQEIATFTPGALTTWGQDNAGEVYLGALGPGHTLYTLTTTSPPTLDPPALLSQLGVFQDVPGRVPSAFMIPFAPAVPFWSDGARKTRWAIVPNDGLIDDPSEQIAFSPAGEWDWPVGSVLVKHFDLVVDEVTGATTPLETRFQVRKQSGGFYGLTYRWLPDGSDAVLLTTAETQDYTIQTTSGSRVQTWLFPSRAQCLQCHDPAISALGPRTQGLNADFTYPQSGITDNQLRAWNHIGLFAPVLAEPDIATHARSAPTSDPTASLEARARGWLDANCGYCHRPDTNNRGQFDARVTTDLVDQGLVYGQPIDDLGVPDASYVHPGDLAKSLVHLRASNTGTVGMPPLAKTLVDQDGIAVLAAWIERIDPGFPQTGVAYEYYEGTWFALPDFDALTPVATGGIAWFDISVRLRDDDFGLRFTTWLDVPESGAYTFFTSSDDGSKLYVDGIQVVNNDGQHGVATQQGTIALAAGFHEVVVTFFEAGGGQTLAVEWEAPGLSTPIPRQIVPTSRLYRAIPSPSPNAPPLLALPAPPTHFVGQAVDIVLAASDPDGDPLYWTASGLPPGLALDPVAGTITGTLGQTPGVYDVVLGVSDGPEVDSATLSFTVLGSTPVVPVLTGAGSALLALLLAAVGGVVARRG